MKNLITITAILISTMSVISAQNQFDYNNVKVIHEEIVGSLETNAIAIEWKEAADDASKVEKFASMLSSIAGPVMDRVWVHPSGGEWPVIDWNKVDKLSKLLQDQSRILEATTSIAANDRELAQVCVVVEAIIASSQKIDLWFEDWLLNLAKSNKKNLKWIAFVTSSGVAEDFNEEGKVSRALDWIKWEQAYNDSDTLGKALLLVYMTELATSVEDYTKVKTIHLQVFGASDDSLKSVALFAGNRMLGDQVIAKWKEIADNHSNPKMKALAQEALDRGE